MLTAAAISVSVWVVVEVPFSAEGASGEGSEEVGAEDGGEGLRRAVKSTADEERCIRAKG